MKTSSIDAQVSNVILFTLDVISVGSGEININAIMNQGNPGNEDWDGGDGEG